MRTFHIALLALAATPFAAGQTLTWTETTTSRRVGLDITHTEHARPVSWAPFLTPQSSARLVLNWSYDVTFTNSGSVPASGIANLVVGFPFLKDDQCWGNDSSSSSSPFNTSGVTVPASGSIQDSGMQTETVSHQITYQFCGSDGIHTATGQSRIFAGPMGPVSSSNWFVSFFPATVTLTVNSAPFTSDVEVTTVYDLPLVASSNGCDPIFANSTGASGALEAYGVADATSGGVVLYGSDLPAGVPGYFVLSASTASPTTTTFGIATLCLGAPRYPWIGSLGTTALDGTYGVELSADGLPIPGGGLAAGDTWHVQFIHRDVDPATGQPTANSTSAVTLNF